MELAGCNSVHESEVQPREGACHGSIEGAWANGREGRRRRIEEQHQHRHDPSWKAVMRVGGADWTGWKQPDASVRSIQTISHFSLLCPPFDGLRLRSI
jgi:hypothetical protein